MAKEYSPDVVAQSFIKQFYEMLAENPSELHRFYMEDSFFTHCEGQQTTPAVQGTEAIRQKVSELHLAGARVDLSEGSVDAQRSDINGVFVVVTGEFAQPYRSLEPKRFVQTFFLASQAPTGQAASMASYFVRNSVFRLLNGPSSCGVSVSVQAGATTAAVDASTATGVPATYSASTSTTEPEAPQVVAPIPAPAPVPTPIAVHVEVPEVHVPEVVVTKAPVAATIVPEPTPVAVAPVIAPEPSIPSAPKSYSDMARAAASQTPASPARFPPRAVTARPSSSAPKALEFTAGSGPGSAKAPSAPAGPSMSVYVKQVPESATEADVQTLFSRFGPVKNVELNGQRGFAFVDYESAVCVQACLASTKEAPLELNGATLKVEERNSRGGGGGPGGNSSGGRSKSGSRREGDTRDRRDGSGRGEGGAGRGAGREGGDRERRDRDRRGPKPEGSSGPSGGPKTAVTAESNGTRASRK